MSKSGISLKPPRGMRDFYPEEMASRRCLFEAWERASKQHGFTQYDSCVVESLDLLKRKGGEEIVDQIYAFKDKSDRDLALRAEMTPTLARMVAAQQNALALPLKWFALAQCFRYERTTRGRKREHYQWNLDVLGEASIAAETEIIATAVRALGLLGLTSSDVTVFINNRALLTELLSSLGVPPEDHAATFLALDKRGKQDDVAIAALLKDAGLADDVIAAVFTLMEVQSLEDAAGHVGADSEPVHQLRSLIAELEALGIADWVQFDISVIRGLGYYTGIVFEAFDCKKQFRAVFGGGRYDNLLADIGGKPLSGVGFGFGDVVIMELLTELGKTPAQPSGNRVTVGYMADEQRLTAMTVAQALRKRGKDVDLGLSRQKAKSFFSSAAKSGCSEAVYIGPDDVENGVIRIKTLDTREERQVKIEDLAE